MAWTLTQQDRESFIQFLEPNPPANTHGNLNVNTFSFYTSELKKALNSWLTLLSKLMLGNYRALIELP
jgi:hypothetical protein